MPAQANYATDAVNQLRALKELLASAGEGKEIETGKELVAAAEANPTKGTVTKVLGCMKQLKEGTGYALATAEGFRKALETLGDLADKLPL